MRELTPDEALRFGRNVLLPEIGLAGQERLRATAVRVGSLGAVGSASTLYLAAAGIGTLVLEDRAPVETADLAGTLYTAEHVGRPRLEAAREALARWDPGLAVREEGDAVCAVEALDLDDEPARLEVAGGTVRVAAGPGPRALAAGAAAALEIVKLVCGVGRPLDAEALG